MSISVKVKENDGEIQIEREVGGKKKTRRMSRGVHYFTVMKREGGETGTRIEMVRKRNKDSNTDCQAE